MRFYAYTPQYHNETSMAMHLCWLSPMGLEKLNRGFGMLFPKAEMAEGGMAGTSKGLVQSWVCKAGEGYAVAALRRNPLRGMEPVEEGKGHCVLFFLTRDLMAYEELGLREVAAQGDVIDDVRLAWANGVYTVSVQVAGEWKSFASADLNAFTACDTAEIPARQPIGLHDAMPACPIDLDDAAGRKLLDRLMPLKHTGYLPAELG